MQAQRGKHLLHGMLPLANNVVASCVTCVRVLRLPQRGLRHFGQKGWGTLVL